MGIIWVPCRCCVGGCHLGNVWVSFGCYVGRIGVVWASFGCSPPPPNIYPSNIRPWYNRHVSLQHDTHTHTHHTAHSTQHTAHSTQQTAHSTQHTAHSTQHTTHITQHTAHTTHTHTHTHTHNTYNTSPVPLRGRGDNKAFQRYLTKCHSFIYD